MQKKHQKTGLILGAVTGGIGFAGLVTGLILDGAGILTPPWSTAVLAAGLVLLTAGFATVRALMKKLAERWENRPFGRCLTLEQCLQVPDGTAEVLTWSGRPRRSGRGAREPEERRFAVYRSGERVSVTELYAGKGLYWLIPDEVSEWFPVCRMDAEERRTALKALARCFERSDGAFRIWQQGEAEDGQ